MQDLVSIIKEIRQVSNHPEREFTRIFEDESVYSRMLETLHVAFMEIFNYKTKLVTPEYKEAIRHTCISAGLKVPSNKQLSDRHYRARLLESLERKKRKDGTSYFDFLRQLVLIQKLEEVYQKHAVEETVTCSKCGLKQKPVKNYIMCGRCGWQGAVIGNLYKWFSMFLCEGFSMFLPFKTMFAYLVDLADNFSKTMFTCLADNFNDLPYYSSFLPSFSVRGD
jgi:hypothetical protein